DAQLRRAVYERARAVTAAQLARHGEHPGDEPEMAMLEAAIAEVEFEAGRASHRPGASFVDIEESIAVASGSRETGTPPLVAPASPDAPALPAGRQGASRKRAARREESALALIPVPGGEGDAPDTRDSAAAEPAKLGARVQAMLQVARYQGVELDPNELR